MVCLKLPKTFIGSLLLHLSNHRCYILLKTQEVACQKLQVLGNGARCMQFEVYA